ncbi:MAG: hypothetical protein R3199_07745 [Gemmatimonadota bacterium]|nr:hypothetical protein [Gemmatimonadota bacterium]
MEKDLRRTSWNRIAVALRVPRTTGIFLLGKGPGRTPRDVVMVGSTRNLRDALLSLLLRDELRDLGIRTIHWVADLTIEQARIAERFFTRRYDPPISPEERSRYHDILAG